MIDKMVYTMDLGRIKGKRFKDIQYYINEKGCFICCSHKPEDDGYVVVGIGNKKVRKLHILSYEYNHKTPVINKNHVMHSCDTPTCFNPEHLSQGTNGDNRDDMKEKGRGSKVGYKPLTKDQIQEIFDDNYKTSAVKLAIKLGVKQRAIETNRQKLGMKALKLGRQKKEDKHNVTV